MSLLLDALKKAALDKQNRNLKADEMETPKAVVTARPLVGTDLPATANNVHIEEELDFEIEIDDEEFERHDNRSAAENSAGPAPQKHPPQKDDSDKAVASEEFATVKKIEREPVHLELAIEHVIEDKPEHEPHPAPTEPAAREEIPPAHPVGDSTPAPAGLALENRQTDTEHRARKAAMAQLLASSQQAAARNRMRRWLFLGGLFVTAMVFIGFYFYYLSIDGVAQPPTFVGHVPAPAIMDEAEMEAIPVQSPDELIDQQAAVEEDIATAPDKTDKNADVAPVETTAEQSVSAQSSVPASLGPLAAPVKTNAVKTPVQSEAIREIEARPAAGIVQRNAPAPNPLSLAIRDGYAAYQRGDLPAAAIAYEKALELSPHHRDALLGAAAVATRQGNQQLALHYYQQRLARAPRDDYARAGILALAGSAQPSPELESEVNRLLREYPKAAHLHFLKGSLQAAKQQWGQAQLAFFEAWRWDKNQPDYAYNLAIAMDHLDQPAEALRLYREALTLAATFPASFASEPVRERIAQLESTTR